jgi:4-deoxy-L-threo-5-hexosulose-uronate ketol-isomerase
VQIRYSPHPNAYSTLNTEQLRSAFLLESLFTPGKVELIYTDTDRAIIGSAVPGNTPLKLVAGAELRVNSFCERRELGVLNIGGPGAVTVDGEDYSLDKYDCLYIGRGSQNIVFKRRDTANPAAFYFLSYPAHMAYPTTLIRRAETEQTDLGAETDSNRRTIHKCIHARGVKSCQLVMGFTQLKEGSVWNTMPPHTHERRSEIYMYFDLPSNRRVMHFMGQPQQTRHMVVADKQIVISPSWSIHSACGTGAYTFCWGMGGENQTFEDMDPAPVKMLR